MTKESKQWVSWEEFNALFPGLTPWAVIDYQRIGGLTPGSIPFADATGLLTQDNANLFWNDTLNVLEVFAPTLNTYIGKGVIGAGSATGQKNVYVGYEVGHDAEDAGQNVIMGYQAGYKHTSGLQNTLIGYYAGHEITESQLNTCVGAFAGSALTTGFGQNTLLGLNAGSSMTTGHHNISIGKDSGTVITTGMGNIFIGHDAEAWETDSNYRIAIGHQALSKEDNLCAIGGGAVSYHLAIFHKREFRFYVGEAGTHYVGFEAPDLGGTQIWVLPAADGDANDVLITDGGGNLAWIPGIATDEKVKVDVGAVADYLGAAFNDGVLRTSAPLTYADGGDFITLGVDQTAIDHNVLTNTHDNPYKLDDLAAPDDNTDLDFSTAKHGLVPKGTDIGHFLRDDGTWAAGGGGGAVIFTDLTDTPANYVGAGDKIVKVNATPDALEFGADIEDLEDVDTLTGQAGKYAKVKAGDAGIEWAVGAGGAIDYLDNFEDASIHWSWRTHNLDADRTIVEAANKLTIAIAAGTNYNWWDTMNDAPKMFTGIGRPPCEIITKLITITTNNETRAGIFVASNPIGIGADYAMMLGRRTVGGVESLQVQRLGTAYTAYGGAPFTTLPIWLKIQITADIRYGNHLRFYYSVNGIDWTEMGDPAGGYSDLLTSDGFVVGLFAQNWNELAVSAEFDFFKVVPCLGADG